MNNLILNPKKPVYRWTVTKTILSGPLEGMTVRDSWIGQIPPSWSVGDCVRSGGPGFPAFRVEAIESHGIHAPNA